MIKDSMLPPHNLDLEMSIIATCFLAGGEALSEIVDLINPEYFYKTQNNVIFQAIRDVANVADSADMVTVAEKLKSKDLLEKAGGVSYLAFVIDQPIAVDIEFTCKRIEEKFLLRKTIEKCYATIKKCHSGQDEFDNVISYFVTSAHDVSDGSKAGDPVSDMKTITMEASDIYEERYTQKKIVTGIPTGIHDLDMMMFGLQPGDLNLLAGRPGMGKTAAAVNIANYACNKGFGTLFISLEMPTQQLVDRLVSIKTGINGMNIRIGNFTKKEFKMVNDAVASLYELPLLIDDRGGLKFDEIRRTVRRQVKRNPDIGLLIIDHLQLVHGNNPQNRNLEIGEISSGLKALAKELRISVLALSQLNRGLENRSNPYKRPRLSDLRDSGSLEQDADNVIFIYRPWEYGDDISPTDGQTKITINESDCELIVAKQRNGPVGTVHSQFFAETQRLVGATKISPDEIYKNKLEERIDE